MSSISVYTIVVDGVTFYCEDYVHHRSFKSWLHGLITGIIITWLLGGLGFVIGHYAGTRAHRVVLGAQVPLHGDGSQEEQMGPRRAQ